MNWNSYYMEQSGHGQPSNYYSGPYYQRGYGLGGMFRKFFNWIVPLVRTHALPAMKTGAKELGKVALESVSDVAKDALAGRDVRESVKTQADVLRGKASEAVDDLKNKAEQLLEGKGIKRRRVHKHKTPFIIRRPTRKRHRNNHNATDIFE